MKNIFKFLLSAFAVVSLLLSCDKKKDLQMFSNGKAVVLTSSATVIAPAPADSGNVAVVFSWTNPGYATDSSLNKYELQIDSSGRGFANPYKKMIIRELDTSMLSKELNTIALNFGFAFNVASDLDVRVISSYGNNNEQYASNTVKISFTPYKVPPKVALPVSGKLFLVGDASQGGWNNPVPAPSQEFAQIDETTFGGVFNLLGGKQYLLLPVNGDWGAKYGNACGSDGCNNAAGDDFKDGGNNIKGPDADGWYTIIMNFQTGKFSVTPYAGTVPDNLFIVGGATAGGWNNPVPTPSQQITKLNSSVFQLTLPLTPGEYLFLPVNGDWSSKFGTTCGSNGCNDAMGDSFKAGGDNFKSPETAGNYKVTVNFVTGRFTVE